MKQRTKLDHDHPCLACGAPWAIIEQTTRIAEPDVPDIWLKVASDCSAQCVRTGRTTVEAYQAALDARRARGW